MIVTATYDIKLSEEDLEMIAERVVRRTNQDSDKNKLLNITESAQRCGVSTTTFYRWRERYQELQDIAITTGGVAQFRAEDLDKFLESK
ncbi:helix-turn-helix domain-containing protein [Ligilactobacillus salivarius]|uniref:helix-turn-helix domain-containing protein n=1 Tax=Ligilactobacillus salivarius TaxID=1624 RepID=UPI00136BAC00|nr:helix-turn-helix domain-containing protein [Ligilactobacillus salivarius]MYU86490.1 helix-turn-helix domain-containing protein [Ligilactobacillus salivarius]MYU88485.1 helix-turn-helix domain-containing protein [Ligilactobacillus salivarius]MYV15512.1 helix-turn-helix domain-containing protein [Ligilactobacillus salivarius]